MKKKFEHEIIDKGKKQCVFYMLMCWKMEIKRVPGNFIGQLKQLEIYELFHSKNKINV